MSLVYDLGPLTPTWRSGPISTRMYRFQYVDDDGHSHYAVCGDGLRDYFYIPPNVTIHLKLYNERAPHSVQVDFQHEYATAIVSGFCMESLTYWMKSLLVGIVGTVNRTYWVTAVFADKYGDWAIANTKPLRRQECEYAKG